MSIIAHVTSIPALLNGKYKGHKSEMIRDTGLNMMTINKYQDDYNLERHAIVNGNLMTVRATSTPVFVTPVKEQQ